MHLKGTIKIFEVGLELMWIDFFFFPFLFCDFYVAGREKTVFLKLEIK